jgi:starvation-inducible DNA-binding protein
MPKTAVRTNAVPQTAAALQPILVDLIALALHAKQAHWNVTGPLFKPLHEMLDEMTTQFRTWYDDVAERIRALGAPADGRPATVAAGTDASGFPGGTIEDQEVVKRMLSLLEGASGRIRDGLTAIGDQDPITQDLLIGVVHGLEKQAWMLRAQRS